MRFSRFWFWLARIEKDDGVRRVSNEKRSVDRENKRETYLARLLWFTDSRAIRLAYFSFVRFKMAFCGMRLCVMY